jgi:peptide-methionine (S)-S-oxide reductase
METIFERIDGVVSVDSGYAGGHVANPSYEQVCTGTTGHAEVVRVGFDPARISYDEILEIFFAFHDPTTLNRQGPDVGTQYRSAIFTLNAEQERIARNKIASLADTFDDPIVTQVEPLDTFWPAEEYHRNYYRLHPEQAYCAATIAPKVAKLRSKWSHRLKPVPE